MLSMRQREGAQRHPAISAAITHRDYDRARDPPAKVALLNDSANLT
jgi:hypothetical protein